MNPNATLRTEAERQLSSHQAWVKSPREADPVKLIHELQVHQIELEMQTQGLADALAEAEALRAKYQDLYELAPVGYLTLSEDGRIVELNRCAARLLGRQAPALVGRKLHDFVKDQAVASLDRFLERAAASSDEVYLQTLALLACKPLPRYVNMQAHATANAPDDGKIRLTLMDVSALKMATDDVVQALDRASDFGSLQ